MVDSSNPIGGGASRLPNQTVDGRAQRSGATGRSTGATPTPSGPRGTRMLSPDTPLSQLDRSAPRGTYLDIVV